MKAKINGKEVDFSLNVGRKIYGKQNGQDLGDLDNGPVNQMFIDPEVFARAVWANYEDRIKEAGVETEEAFFELVGGDLRRDLEKAVKEAITDFFPWGKMLVEKIEEHITNMGQTVDQLVQSGLASGSMPESSE